VFNIERYAVYDGPGIRTLVFLKGCPLRCLWCANPEGQNIGTELILFPEKCIGCRECIKVCPSNAIVLDGQGRIKTLREKCIACGKCTKVCYPQARKILGQKMTAREVVSEVVKDFSFFDSSGGGVTLSGGEPLMQINFATSILKGCKKKGIHTAVETAAYVPWKNIFKIIKYVDLFFVDIKHMDPERHKALTGVSNKIILKNISSIVAYGKEVIVRITIIPGINDCKENIENTAIFVAQLGIKKVELLPYHLLGVNKYKRLGRQYPLSDIQIPKVDKLENLRQIVKKEGLICEIL